MLTMSLYILILVPIICGRDALFNSAPFDILNATLNLSHTALTLTRIAQ